MALVFIYETDSWDTGAVTYSTTPDLGVLGDPTPILSYKPGEEFRIGVLTPPTSLTFEITYGFSVFAESLAIIGLNFSGNVSLTADGSPVQLDTGYDGVLPTASYGQLHRNNKMLLFEDDPQIATTYRITFTNIRHLLDVPTVTTQGLRYLSISRVAGGRLYRPPRSYKAYPQIDYRRAGERSHQGSFVQSAEYPLYRRIKMLFDKTPVEQKRRFRDMWSRRAVRNPVVMCWEAFEGGDVDENTAYVQPGNKLGTRPYLGQHDLVAEFDEVVN